MPALDRSIAAALDWWREAGVDCDFLDAPQNWIAAPAEAVEADPPAAATPGAARVASAPAPAEAPRIGGGRSTWPATLPGFAHWWLSEPSLAPPGARRLPPRGDHGAELLVIVPMPAEDDEETLLSGKAGRLLDGFLTAAGIDAASVYRAALLPARIAMPDWDSLVAAGLGAIALHHIALVAPQRVLVFGQAGISALGNHSSPHSAAHLRTLNHEFGTAPAMFAYDLEALLARPALKAGVWTRWLDWTGTEPQ